ncbi:hypothetical protein AXF14_04350 [Actinomyces radicidentis]|uniref:Uncharacterized protein n=1 Tax=Actinomyces radicidentis TaxID=111015 RepID=A0A0X8JE61_ACTRD|nr:hypothetical protein AXF14_04350 [Actinomyces radicidentis]
MTVPSWKSLVTRVALHMETNRRRAKPRRVIRRATSSTAAWSAPATSLRRVVPLPRAEMVVRTAPTRRNTSQLRSVRPDRSTLRSGCGVPAVERARRVRAAGSARWRALRRAAGTGRVAAVVLMLRGSWWSG